MVVTKMLQRLSIAALAMSISYVQTHAYSNKTFLAVRPGGANAPMVYSTFDGMIQKEKEDGFGAHLQVSGFYQGTANGQKNASYFSPKETPSITLNAIPTDDFASSPGLDVDAFYLIHARNLTTGALITNAIGTTSITLKPEQNVFGVNFAYYQDLKCLNNKLFVYAEMPVVRTENAMNLQVQSTGTLTNASGVLAADTPLSTVLTQYFAGSFSNAQATNAQSALTAGKIAAKSSAGGVADIDFGIGYKLLEKENAHASIAFAVTAPTGNTATGEYAFEPMYGNGGSFGIGGNLQAHGHLWKKEHQALSLNAFLKYRYLLQNTQQRTAGIVGRNWGQYFLLIKSDTPVAAAGTPLTPAANILNQAMLVTPGNQFSGMLGLSYHHSALAVDAGYCLHAKDGETVTAKAAMVDNQYAIAARNYDTRAATTSTTPAFAAGEDDETDGGDAAGTSALINSTTVDCSAAATPSVVSHSIYANVAYAPHDGCCFAAAGTTYEWPSSNNAFEQWSVWLKAGVNL